MLANEHRPDTRIMPYWSDRVSRKLAENTNTAWGGSLKLETSLLSMVFTSSGNHLVAHAYQVLSPNLSLCCAFFRLLFVECLCDGALKHTHTHRNLKLQANLPHLCNLGISAAMPRYHEATQCTVQHVEVMMVYNNILSLKLSSHFPQQRLQTAQISSVTVKYCGTVTGIPSLVIPGWPLLCLSAIPTNNTTQ